MTDLNRPVKRRSRTQMPYRGKQRRIAVMLIPGDVIGMRLEGTRKTYAAEIKSVYWQLVRWHAAAEVRRKAEERKARKKGIV